MKSKYKGIFYIISSAFFFALMNAFIHLSGDLPFYQKAFFRNFVAMLVALSLLLKDRAKGNKIHLTKGSFKYLFMRAAFGTLGLLGNFYAVDRLVLSDASMLQKISPFAAIIASYFVLKEKIKPFQIIIVLTAFIGCLFVIKPSMTNVASFPAFVALLGGIGAGLAYTMVRKLGEMKVKGPFIVFFFSAFSCVILLPFVIVDFHPMSAYQWIMLLLVGAAASGGQFSITAAYFHAPAKEISIYEYTQIIFAALFGFIFFGQLPDVLSVVGYIIVTAAALLSFMKSNSMLFFKKSEKNQNI